MEKINLGWNDARKLIEDADILLYRGSGIWSKWLKWAGHTEYTHAAVACSCNGFWQAVMLREFKGGISVSLEREIELYDGEIDVYRLTPSYDAYEMINNQIMTSSIRLTKSLKNKICLDMYKLGGISYSWKRIWNLAKYHIPILRWFTTASLDDKAENPENMSMVCSTSVVFCIRKNYIDIVPHLSDHETVPGDISRSSATTYLFTLVK